MRIIVDAMGGDNAPGVPVKASVKAINNKENINIVLVGNREVIEEKLAGLKNLLYLCIKERTITNNNNYEHSRKT